MRVIDFKEEIAKLLADRIAELGADEIREMIEIPQESRLGDYAFPCFRLAKARRAAPQSIAHAIAESVGGTELFERVEAVGAYVNMFLKKSALIGAVLPAAASEKERFGGGDLGEGRMVIV